MLEGFEQLERNIISTLKALAGLAREIGLRSLEEEIRNKQVPHVLSGVFQLAVVGEFNHGKTTLVNALLGQPLLPTGVLPTTAVLHRVEHGDQPEATAVYGDGTRRRVELGDLERLVSVNSDPVLRPEWVEVRFPSPLLQNRVVLYDTPGVNDLSEQRAEVTYGLLPQADATIMVLDATQVLKRTEQVFLTSRILRRSRDRVVFAVNKIDLLQPAEQQEVLAFARVHLAPLIPDPPLFPLSATGALAGQEAHVAQLEGLRDYVSNEILQNRGRVILDNAVGDGLRAVGLIKENLALKRRALSMSEKEMEEEIHALRTQMRGSHLSLEESKRLIQEGSERIKARMIQDLKDFAQSFIQALPVEILKVSSGDVKRYLPFFIQDKFREWAEGAGEEMGRSLEALAGEVIRATNEEIQENLKALGQRLGTQAVPVDIEVDTLLYDVGVFALATFGTTIMLFVNVFVGGLMTIAAPVLAFAMKGRVEEKVRERAQEQGILAIQQAAKAMEPRIDEFVQDFTNRLEAFVESAGMAMAQSVAEALEELLKNRRRATFDRQRSEEEIDRQLQDLSALGERLWAWQERLWGRG